MSKERRLAAIMFTDIVGYSAMMQKDEKGSLVILNRHRNILEARTAAHDGKVIQYYGDGSLSVYKSGIEAVNCAIEMQEAFRSDPKVPLRIGIHLGDIVIGDGNVYGDGVNVTSRIESLGVPGCILVSKRLQEDLINHPEFKSVSMGKFEFKNITRPLEVFAISNEGLAVPDKETIKGKLKEKNVNKEVRKKLIKWMAVPLLSLLVLIIVFQSNKTISVNSLAVLPFADYSQEKDQAWLTDGMTNTLTNELRKISALTVPSSTTMRTYKETDKTLPEIAKELNVDAVIEGSAMKISNDSVRITATLIKADEKSLWSHEYVVGMKDFYVLNHDIAQKITKEINIVLTPADSVRFTSPSLVNPEALEADLKGMEVIKTAQNFEDVKLAVKYFQKAIELDSTYARPYAQLAWSYSKAYPYFSELSPLESLKMSEAVNKIALRLDPQLTLAYLNQFHNLYFIEWKWEEALGVLSKAQSLSLNDVEVLDFFVDYYVISGKFDKAFNTLEELRKIKGFQQWYFANKMYIQFHSRNLEGVLRTAEEGLKLFGNYPVPSLQMWSLSLLGRHKEAVIVARSMLNNEIALSPVNRGEIGCVLARAGLKSEALEQLQIIKALELNFIDPVSIGVIYMGLGDNDMAMEYFEQGYKSHSPWMVYLKRGPPFDPIRGDSRFEKLIQKLKFP
ncbi:MAG: hypothetical protein KJO00_05330 [Bacteroidia bacterium]|nr:hypothetical protein [Bacteroidia bacterium]NNK72915.1 hypothetical protein [Flavobacteriaceae bacterium]